MNNHLTLSTMLIAGAVLAGCSTMPQNARLDDARSQVKTAEGNAQVAKLAPMELKQAKDALTTAEQAWQKNEKAERVDELAYLAKRRALIAEETAKLKIAEQSIETATAERDKVRLDARTLEADRAQQSAEASEAKAAETQRQLESEQRQSQAIQEQAQQQSVEAQRQSLAAQEQARQQSAEAQRQAQEAQLKLEETQRQAQEAQLKLEETQRQAQSAEARADQLDAQLKELDGKKTERGIVVTLGGDVLFDTNMAQLKAGGMRNVEKIAEFLKKNPERNVLVEGFTDSTGTGQYNEQLSERRAEAVRSAILKLVSGPANVQIRGYGQEYPIASNDTAVGRQLNRRVEIVVSDDTGNITPRNAAGDSGGGQAQ